MKVSQAAQAIAISLVSLIGMLIIFFVVNRFSPDSCHASGTCNLKITRQKPNTAMLQTGTKLTIQLAANHTTGYSWAVDYPKDLLELTDQQYVTQKDITLMGAPGKSIFKFKALKPGQGQIIFNYRRPWEKDVKPVSTEVYNVVIED